MRDRLHRSWREKAAYAIIAAAGLSGAFRAPWWSVVVIAILISLMRSGLARRTSERGNRGEPALRAPTVDHRSKPGSALRQFLHARFPVRDRLYSGAGTCVAFLGSHEVTALRMNGNASQLCEESHNVEKMPGQARFIVAIRSEQTVGDDREIQ